MEVTGPKVVAFWGFLLFLLLIFNIVGHESLLDHAMWSAAVLIIWTMSLLLFFAGRRAPVHRGSYSWPMSASPTFMFSAAAVCLALGGVYGDWFAVMAPVPFALAIALGLRDHSLNKRMRTENVIDRKAPAHLSTADATDKEDRLDPRGSEYWN